MNIKKFLICTLFIGTSIANIKSATAFGISTSCDLTCIVSSAPADDSMFANILDGTVVNKGDSGTITFIDNYDGTPSEQYGPEESMATLVRINIPSNSMITFSYSAENYDPRYGYLFSLGQVSYDRDNLHYVESTRSSDSITPYGTSSYSNSRVNSTYEDGSNVMTPVTIETPLIFAAAQLDHDNPNSATGYIINNSSESFAAANLLFHAYYDGYEGSQIIQFTYEVTATPLPAALPMFAFGLSVMFGLRRQKNTLLAKAG